MFYYPFIPLRETIRSIEQKEDARERTLTALDKFNKAQADLERICKELGLEVPDMVCGDPTKLTLARVDKIERRIFRSVTAKETYLLFLDALRQKVNNLNHFLSERNKYLLRWEELNLDITVD